MSASLSVGMNPSDPHATSGQARLAGTSAAQVGRMIDAASVAKKCKTKRMSPLSFRTEQLRLHLNIKQVVML